MGYVAGEAVLDPRADGRQRGGFRRGGVLEGVVRDGFRTGFARVGIVGLARSTLGEGAVFLLHAEGSEEEVWDCWASGEGEAGVVAKGGPVEGLVGRGVVVVVVVRVAGSSSLGLGWWMGGWFVATHEGDAFADELVDVYAG